MIENWGYGKTNGPSTWSNLYPSAGGQRQSPVDIKHTDVQQHDDYPKLFWNYVPENVESIENTGFGWKVNVDRHGSELSGGPLESKYELEQFHCHWGNNDDEGSEHTINGKPFAGELHLVHTNAKYSSFEEAIEYPDGLCVLGVFLTPGKAHPEMDKIIDNLSSIRFKNMISNFGVSIDPASFIPQSSTYWTYQGSLTTPPCSECVTWIVFEKPIEVSSEQLIKFRNSMSRCLQNSCHCKKQQCTVCTNYRPTLPIGQRVVKKCNQ